MEARWMGFSFWLNIYHSWYLPWRQKQALFLTWKRASEKATGTVGHHLFDTMCPTAFLAPTLTAKTCFICTQPQNAFFLAQLALQGNRANGKKSLPGRVPGPKNGTKMVPKSGSFQEEFFLLSGQKKSRFIKWQTPSRNAKSSFEGASPTPPSPMQQWRRPARTTIVSRTVGGLGSAGDKTVLLGPKNWNPISSSKCTVLARHG